MTQSPQSGQTAPRTTDFGAGAAARQRSATNDTNETPPVGAPWGSGPPGPPPAQNPAFGAPVHADAPTGSMPPLVTGTAFQSAAAPPRPANHEPPPPARPPSQARTARARSRGPRRARLQLRHINPWTVLKFSCVLSIALFFVWLIVIGVLFGILDAAGIIEKINDTVTTLNGPGSDAPITAGVVFGGAAIIGVVNIVLFIALSTVGSVVYNLCADLVGGIEITLSER